MPIEIELTEAELEMSEGQKLMGKMNKALEYFENSPAHYKTVLAIGVVVLVAILVIFAKTIFWMGMAIGVLYLVGVKTLQKKERPAPMIQKDW
jgi:hypothetical protein